MYIQNHITLFIPLFTHVYHESYRNNPLYPVIHAGNIFSFLHLLRNKFRTLKLRLLEEVSDLTEAATPSPPEPGDRGSAGTGGGCFSNGRGPRTDSLRFEGSGVGPFGGESLALTDEYAESGGGGSL